MSHLRERIGAEWARLVKAAGCEPKRPAISAENLLERDVPLSKPGAVSANGSCHLLRAKDGWIALNLARLEEREALPALLEQEAADLASKIAKHPAEVLRERATMLQMPLAILGETQAAEPALLHARSIQPRPIAGLRVLDLSALWAGPLCAGLLAQWGAEVTKVEDPKRRDTVPGASPQLDARINGWKHRRTLDLRENLPDLLAETDVLVTSGRPRALASLGLDADRVLGERPQLLWIAITAHGWRGAAGERVGFGDDCAVAGGLVDWHGDTPRFRGDALADPLTGLVAARAAMLALAEGRTGLLDCALAPTAALFAEGTE